MGGAGTRAFTGLKASVLAVPLAWRRTALLVFLAWVAALVLLRDTTASLIAVWSNSQTFAHGFAVLPISLFLMWKLRRRLDPLVPRPHWAGFVLVALLTMVWMAGWLMDLQIVQHAALVALLPSLVLAIAGIGAVRAMLFPLGFLIFAIPAGDTLLTAPLQDVTAVMCVAGLKICGIPIEVDGWAITIPSGPWRIAEACAGLRYLTASLFVGTLFAFTRFETVRARAGFILVAAVVAVISNGLRAFGMLLFDNMTDGWIWGAIDHRWWGFFFYAVIIFVLFRVADRWGHARPIGERFDASEPAADPPRRWPGYCAAAVCVALLGRAPVAESVMVGRLVAVRVLAPAEFAVQGSWRPFVPTSGWEPRYPGAADRLRGTFISKAAVEVHLFLGFYGHRTDAEMIHVGNQISDLQRWQFIGSATRSERGRDVREFRLVSPTRKRVVWRWYWVAGEFTTSDWQAKVMLARALLKGESRGSAVMLLAAEYEDDPEEARRALRGFLEDAPAVRPMLESCFSAGSVAAR